MLKKMSDTLRFLSVDMISKANSGHPGAPMGLADILTVLATNHLHHNPKNPKWLNRDRVVFSGGHASALVYSYLHLTGYDVSVEELQNFRQLGSKTAGHPEYGHVEGVEITTGPLGQGVANAVGMAMASRYSANLLNEDAANVIDHNVYCFCGDGDLQEGISYEACALAGHLNLDNLVVIYDSNAITIEGDTSIAWSEDVKARFEAQNWQVIEMDGHNYEAIDASLTWAKAQSKPILIIAKTIIAKGACEMEGSHHAHGAPLSAEEIACAKKRAGFPNEDFYISEDVLLAFRCAVEKGELHEKEWNHLLLELPYKEQNEALNRLQNPDFSAITYPEFEEGEMVATRDSNGKILNAIAKEIVGFVGGSADLAPSNKTELKNMGDFPKGKNMHFGIREHAMGAITNGMAVYGNIIPFNATFFVFSDYLKPAVRVAALSKLKSYFVWTHDSIGVGEDGPTHEPIEQLTQFRALPNFYLFRPADASENVACWQQALKIDDAPCGFVLSRQKLKTLPKVKPLGDVENGGYLVIKQDKPAVTLIASGSEVGLAVEASVALQNEGINANVVSVPCFELFVAQDEGYQASIISPEIPTLAIEASSGIEWYRFSKNVLSMENSFGASGNANELFKHFGFSVENITARVKEII